MRFSLRILPRAENDAQHIFDYIADRSPEGALRWWDALQQAAWKITENPQRYGYAPENSLSHFDPRQFLFKTRRGRTYRGVFAIVNLSHLTGMPFTSAYCKARMRIPLEVLRTLLARCADELCQETFETSLQSSIGKASCFFIGLRFAEICPAVTILSYTCKI